MNPVRCALFDDWHPVAVAGGQVSTRPARVRLLATDIDLQVVDGRIEATLAEPASQLVAKVKMRYGLVWVCLGSPRVDIPTFAPVDDPEQRVALCGPFGVATSAPRVIENFLDKAHFPFVHPGVLGVESHTEVVEYKVAVEDERLVATECKFWQPQFGLQSSGGAVVLYRYELARPLVAILTKLPEQAGDRCINIYLAVQPVEGDRCAAWILYAVNDLSKSAAQLRALQERVFLQDKPIVENQIPAQLPLVPGAEVPLPCDRLSIAYRRFLARKGVSFGVVRGNRGN